MTKQSFFSPGQTIVLREMWQGKVWSARPEIVVRDEPALLALYLPLYSVWKQPKTHDGKRVSVENRSKSEWILGEDRVNYRSLRLTIPGEKYSVLLLWDLPDMWFTCWYINLEDALSRSLYGFEYLDQFLDIIVSPDLSAWYWKDEDELAEAIACGLISSERAAYLHTEGERVVNWIQSGKSPFNEWVSWKPDPSWKIPVLPEGWDKI